MGFYDSELYKRAKEVEDIPEELPYKKKSKKAPTKKATHKHTYVEYIEAESENPDSNIHQIRICTQCGKSFETPMIFHKIPERTESLLILNLGQALACGLSVVIRGHHLFGKVTESD